MRAFSKSSSPWWWAITGLLLITLNLVLVWSSNAFASAPPFASKPVIRVVGIEILAGLVYLSLVVNLRSAGDSPRLLVWVIAIGLLLRALMFLSIPVMEDDFYRYFWDGAVVAHGGNPYAFSPEQVSRDKNATESKIPLSLRRLADDPGSPLARINHPQFRTIYPPVAQAAFALAYGMHPWSLNAWRLVLLGFDLVTLGLLLALLRELKLPLLSLSVYWWNPLLVKEIFNSGHMDLVLLPFLLGALLLALRGKYPGAAAVLGLAVGVKVWPLLLAPAIFRPLLRQPKRLFTALSVFALVTGILFYPMTATGLGSTSGFHAYSLSWENNDLFFNIVSSLAQRLTSAFNLHLSHRDFPARVVAGLLLAAIVFYTAQRRVAGPGGLCEQCLIIIAALYLLGPTGFPWYYVWLLPFLALRSRPSLLILTPLLSLYYFRNYFVAHSAEQTFLVRVAVGLEFVPAWILLGWEWLQQRRRAMAPAKEAIA